MMPRNYDKECGDGIPSQPPRSNDDMSECSSWQLVTRGMSDREVNRDVESSSSDDLVQDYSLLKQKVYLEKSALSGNNNPRLEGGANVEEYIGNKHHSMAPEPVALIRNNRIRPTPRVGAFSVAGMGAVSIHVSSLSSDPLDNTGTTASTQESTVFSILNAHVVDEESPSAVQGPFVEAMPMDDNQRSESLLKALLESRKYRITLALVILLVVGLIVTVVLLTRNAPDSKTQAANELLVELKPLLSNESVVALENPDSPQSLSLRWLLERSNFGAWPFHRQVQRYAMATFYYATDGPSWSNGGNWLTDGDECTWFQGSVGDFCENGTLRILNQSNDILHGLVPDEIRLLSSLTTINLKGNELSGTLPDLIGSFPSLKILDLASNFFSGTLPSSLSKLTGLQELRLSDNFFNGTIPPITTLSALAVMDLRLNEFSGTLPDFIGNFKALKVLNLSDNFFAGPLPSYLGELTALQELVLSTNDITGTIPNGIAHADELIALDLGNCFLSGMIPTIIGKMTNLHNLQLGANSFSGPLPSEIGDLSKLTSLVVSNNTLTGQIPSELGFLSALETLSLHSNELGGTVPTQLGKCLKVATLELDSNFLVGRIPSELGSLTGLKLLSLYDNNLSGAISDEVCLLKTANASSIVDLQVDCYNTCTCCPTCLP